MLKHCFALFLTLAALYSNAQNSLIVLTEKGSLFTLIVNDKQINDSAQSVVEAKKLYDDTCHIKILFTDKNISSFAAMVFLTEGGKTVSNREFTYSLSEHNGKRSLKFVSINQVCIEAPDCAAPESKIDKLFKGEKLAQLERDRLAEKYPEPSNCVEVISDTSLALAIQKLRDQHIEITRLKDAKWFVSTHCINVKQLMDLMGAFDRSENRLKIAEFAFDYLQDHRDFLQVKTALKFPSDVDELEKFYHKHIEK